MSIDMDGLADIAAYMNGLGTPAGKHYAIVVMEAIAALGEKQGVTFFKCTFDGDPPAPHKSWMDWCVSRMYTNVLIRAHEFGVPVPDALGEKRAK